MAHGGGGHGVSSFDGGHGSTSGGDHDGYGHAYHGGEMASSGGCHGGGFAYGHLNHALAFMGLTEGSEDGGSSGCGRKVRLPGMISSGRSVQALVWPHGICDTEELVKCLLKKHGFVDIGLKRRGCAPSTKLDNELRDTTPFDGHMFNSPMPSGYFDGATGHTRSWLTYWQLPRKKYWWSESEVDLEEPVYVALTGSCWFFREMSDFESRILFTVVSRPTLKNGKWEHRVDLVEKHLECCKVVGAEFLCRMKDCDPSRAAVIARQVRSRAEELAERTAAAQRVSEAARALLPADSGSRGIDAPVDGPGRKRLRPVEAGEPDPLQFDEHHR